VKPDTTGLMVLWFLLWALARWRERRRLIFGFVLTLTALLSAAEFTLPHWMGRFLAALREYPAYGADPTILDVLLPAVLARMILGLLVIVLALQCWRWRKAVAGSEEFRWALAWVAAVTLAIIPKLAAYNQLLLIPALLVLLAHVGTVANPLARILSRAALACQIWQWLAASVLGVGSLVISAASLRKAAEIPLYTLLALVPLTLAAILSNTYALRSRATTSLPKN